MFSGGGAIARRHNMTAARTAAHLAHGELTGQILGCFYDVASTLGHGFSEAVLCRALAIALEEAGMDVGRKVAIEVCFRGRSIGVFYPDLIVNQTILVEVKATASIENFAIAQTLNYLKVAGGGVGLLLNFGHKAESQRLVMGDPFNSLPVLRQSTEQPAEGDNVAEKL